jgi:hypothetical protein
MTPKWPDYLQSSIAIVAVPTSNGGLSIGIFNFTALTDDCPEK